MREALAHLDAWRRAVDDPALLAAAARAETTPASVSRLRAQWSAELVAVALDLVAARRKAARKFPRAETLVADQAGVEQASSAGVARHKAERFRAAGSVIDLCCGIGGDAMALAETLGPDAVHAVDLEPVRAWMTERNAGCGTSTADVQDVDNLSTTRAAFHFDPARRDEESGRRRWDPVALLPGPKTLAALRRRWPAGAVKLGPGLDPQALPEIAGTEVEFIAHAGTMVQAVAWHGTLARHPGQHTATHVLSDHSTRSTTGMPLDLAPPLHADRGFGRFLLVPDVALERARLVEPRRRAVQASSLHAGLGLLTADAPCNDPWFKQFRVLTVVPWRDRTLRAALRSHDAGDVVVRTRGGAVDPDTWARRLRGSGARPIELFGLRLGRAIVGVLTESSRNSCADVDNRMSDLADGRSSL